MGAGHHGKAPLSTQDSGGRWTRRSKVWFPNVWEFVASVVFIAQSALFVRGACPTIPSQGPLHIAVVWRPSSPQNTMGTLLSSLSDKIHY